MTDPNEHAFAWPSLGEHENGRTFAFSHGGLTKREYFAGQALRGAIGWHGIHEDPKYTKPENIAKDCVSLADALIAELNKKEAV